MRNHSFLLQINASLNHCHHGSRCSRRAGIIVVFVAVMLVVMFGFVAFAVDTGYILCARTRLQTAADAGALAGVGVIAEGATEVTNTVNNYAMLNQSVGSGIATEHIDIELGDWDKDTDTFTAGTPEPTTVRVTITQPDEGLFFGRVLGVGSFDASAQAIATIQPRDIMVVIDCSSSMNNDSEFKSFGLLGQTAVEDNQFEIYNELGAPTFGSMQWNPIYLTGSTSAIKTALGLDEVPYPYPRGSWDDYIDYMQVDEEVDDADYEDRYGYLTLTQYWIAEQAQADQTPDLWMTSQQPIEAVKQGFYTFIDYLEQTDVGDQVGLAIYTHPSAAGAIVESGLTTNFAAVEDIVLHRQAKHYVGGTNIGAGMQAGRLELENNGRPTARQVMVLMTDGRANLPNDDDEAEAFVLDEAQAAADSNIVILTISVGASADTDLMQQVADITGGVHFNVPGGQSVAAYTAQLQDVFRRAAAARVGFLVQ